MKYQNDYTYSRTVYDVVRQNKDGTADRLATFSAKFEATRCIDALKDLDVDTGKAITIKERKQVKPRKWGAPTAVLVEIKDNE